MRGGASPTRLSDRREVVQTVLPYNEANEGGGRVVFYPVLRSRRRNDTAKIKPVNGSKVEIFLRPLQKYTTCPLIGLIGETDGCAPIVLDWQVWYNFAWKYQFRIRAKR